jgi:peptidoglycan/LPS O-acetylase OafA/YrhL
MSLLSPPPKLEVLTASLSNAPAASPERWPALDGLRGMALLAVMGLHTAPAILPGGFLGVDLFFVLSGFLITYLLVRERQKFGSISLSGFYWRRALRLYPALWGLLLVTGLATLALGTHHDLDVFRRTVPSVVLYFFNWRLAHPTCPEITSSFQHLWSLAIEDQFYLVWPLLLAGLLALRVRRRYILALVLAAVLAPNFLRMGLAPPHGAANTALVLRRIYVGTDSRADSLFAGCFVGLLAGWGLGPKTKRGLALLRWAAWPAAGVVLFHFLAGTLVPGTKMLNYFYYRGGFTIVAISVALVIAALIWSPPPRMARFLEAPGLRWVGAVSYGAYLWNYPLVGVLMGFPWPDIISRNITVLLWVSSLTAGAVSHYYLEAPFLRLKHRWEGKRNEPAAFLSRATAA